MKIVMLKGSPHANGTTAALADAFLAGLGSHHQVSSFNVGTAPIKPCTACNHCRKNDGPCVHQDGMAQIYPALAQADAVVFVTPLYYYGISAQLKAVIDRFYAINATLRSRPRDVYLLAACEDDAPTAMDALLHSMQAACTYLGWPIKGNVLAFNCNSREDILKTGYLAEAGSLAGGI